MDYYSTLGIKQDATADDIKKAYRSMAMKHHPDRGGNEADFKRISEAYNVLSDPSKKQMVDAGVDPNNQQRGGFGGGNPFEFHFNAGNMEEMFSNFGFNGQRRSQPRNKSFNINVEITLGDVLQGKVLNAEVGIPGGQKKIINISIPAGIEHGQQIRYEGMGDSSLPAARPGDLIVNVYIRPHTEFKREGDSLTIERSISVWDALLGTSVEIVTLDNKTLSITIPSGTQPDTILSGRGQGLPNIRSKVRGNLLIKIKVSFPKNLSVDQLKKIQTLKDGL
jgi:curved DNA-binding protein